MNDKYRFKFIKEYPIDFDFKKDMCFIIDGAKFKFQDLSIDIQESLNPLFEELQKFREDSTMIKIMEIISLQSGLKNRVKN